MVYGRSIVIGVLFLAIVITISILIFYLSLGSCPIGTFSCDEGNLCVPQRQICDYRHDCQDGSDEDPVECGLLFGSKQMTNKIVGNAIEKQRKKKNNQDNNSLLINNNNKKWNNHKQYNYNKNCVLKYPKGCNCKQNNLLYCGPNAQLNQTTYLVEELTNLIIIKNKFKINETTFIHCKNLQKLKLKYNNMTNIPAGSFGNLVALERLDIRHNNFHVLPSGIFNGLINLQWLFLSSNQLKLMPIHELANDLPNLEWLVLTDNHFVFNQTIFPRMKQLLELYLDYNRISSIDDRIFAKLDNLHLLNLNGNLITYIHRKAFWGLTNIRDIRLSDNPLKHLAIDTFYTNRYLDALSLGHTFIQIERQLLQTLNISYLNLTGIRSDAIDFKSINQMNNLKYIIYDRFYFCSLTPNVRMCKPNTDGISSFRDLLSKPILRYSTWIMAFVTVTGNVMVLWGRFIYRDENLSVTMVIRNLALADILMGFYLLAIGFLDHYYRNEYHRAAMDWITSWSCVAIGVLAVSSAEVSVFILAFMSLERFLLIANPFHGYRRISMKNLLISLIGIWLLGISIAVVPVILWHSSTRFYGTYSGTCFPLHIQEPYPLGWQYSAFIFLGINLLLLIMIVFLYTSLLISIYRTRKATPLSILDCQFAVRFFFIVLTDVLCWAPIIIVKIWVFFNYNISDDIYAWLVVFIIPLNSAVNPLLYTFTTPKYRNQVLICGWNKITSCRRENSLALVTIGSRSTNADDSVGKMMSNSK